MATIRTFKRRASLEGFRNESLLSGVVLQKVVQWDAYANGSANTAFLSSDEVSLIKEIDKAPEDDLKNLFDEENGPEYARALITALTKISVEETIQYLLCMIEHVMDLGRDKIKIFNSVENSHSCLMAIINRGNYHPFSIEKAAKIMGILLSCESQGLKYSKNSDLNLNSIPESTVSFLNWIFSHISNFNSDQGVITAALVALKEFLKSPQLQSVFLEERGLRVLSSLLTSKASRCLQIVYLTGFCCWLLSFNPVSVDNFMQSEILEYIVSTLRNPGRDKVIRIYLAVLRNLVNKAVVNEILINLDIIKVLRLLSLKKMSDDDAKEDLEYLLVCLEKEFQEMSSFEIFEKEIASGKLRWTQVHTDKFWKENVNRCEENDFFVIKSLIDYLNSDNDQTVAIACYDLGEFVSLYPGGKKILTRLHGKSKLMQQMTHSSPEVQRQAILAVQKLLINNWSSLQD